MVSMGDGKWKFHERRNGNHELYDLVSDVEERNNIAEKHPEVVSKLKKKIEAWEATLPKRNHLAI